MKRSLVFGAWSLVIITSVFLARATDTRAASPEMSGVADLIIYNAKVLTVNSNFTVADAIAIKDGRILAVGKDRRLEEYRGPETRIIDAQSRIVMPGLYDANTSSFAAAASELMGPVPAIDSIAQAQAYIRKRATNTPPGTWIVLNFIPPTRLKEGRLPTKDELDAATTSHPVCWEFGPVAVVNSKALEVSKVDKDTQVPFGGEIPTDPRHHRPTGVLRNATSVLKLPPAERPPTVAQERAALKHLYHLYNEQGITSIGEPATSPAVIDLFRDMSRSNELTVRINCGRLFQPTRDADESIDRLDAITNAPAGKLPYGPTGVGDNWVRIGPLQTIIDGNTAMGTAYLRTPYGIGPTYMISELAYRGELKQNAFALPQVYLEAAQHGWQLEAHCAGDAALDFLLNCYEEVQFKLDIRDRRFLIANSEFQAAQDWIRCQKLGVGAILEPTCLYEDGASLTQTLGTNRLTYYMPLKTWFDRGIVAGNGSGHFIGLDSLKTPNSWNPWLSMWITLKRETKQGGEINPQEKLTREQAVRFYTYNNAWLNFEDKDKGSLEPGKLADLIMLDTDILKCPVDDIRNTKVLLTLVNGKPVWQAVEPIFPGPQVIQSVTINVPSQPVNVVVPSQAVPAAASGQSAVDSAKQAATATTGVNPYAPVADTAAPPVVVTPVSSATATATASVATNPAPTVAATAQPAISTNSNEITPVTASATTAPSTNSAAAAPASATTAEKPAKSSEAGFTSVAGAAPAEVGGDQRVAQAAASAAAAAVVTNQAAAVEGTKNVPSAVTNQVSNAISTNAANSFNTPTPATASAPAQPQAAATVATDASVITTTNPPPNSVTTDAANQTAAAATASQTPATAAGPSQVASATASGAAANTTTSSPTTGATTSQSTTAPTTHTNSAGGLDWSRLLPPGSR